MAIAPNNMDDTAQQLADKVMGKIKDKVHAQIDARIAQSKASQDGGNVIKLWSRIPEGHPYTAPQSKADLGLRGARVVRAYAATKGMGQDIPRFLSDTLKDKETCKIVEKSLATTTPSAGGALVLDEFLANEFYPLLRDHVSIYGLGARIIPMPKGTLSIAGFDTGATIGWVGEARGKQATGQTFGKVRLSSKKAYGIISLSNDLLEESDLAVDEMVKMDMLDALTELLTHTAVHGTGSEYSPKGIALDERRTQVSIGALLTQDDPVKFVLALKKAKVNFDFTSAGWLFNSAVWAQFYSLKTTTGAWIFRDEMNEGKLMGYPFQVTESVSTGSDAHGLTHILFGKWSELIVGVTRDIMVEMSRDASLRLDEAGNAANAFEDDLTFIKLTQKLDMGLRIGKAMTHASDVYTIA